MTLLGFVGDVLIDRDDPDEAMAPVAPMLAEVDLLFGNCEAPYTTAGELAPTSGIPLKPHPSNTSGLHPFDVMSLANNHIVDFGHRAMLETAELVRAAGAIPVGVGSNLEEARRPAVLEHGGLRVAYLAYASVFPYGYEARRGWPGLAPLRSHNVHVERLPNYWSPGIPGRVASMSDETDHANLASDIAAARRNADLVVVSVHWGNFEEPYTLTDHERRSARFAVDHGADIVVGHHHHMLRGIEWYAGKPIFYGLGHFVFDMRMAFPDWYFEVFPPGEGYALGPREGWPLLPLHPDTRMTGIALVDVAAGGALAARFLPCALHPDGTVHPCDAASAEGQTIVDYLTRCNTVAGLQTDLSVSGTLGGLPTVTATPGGDAAEGE